MFTFVYGCAHDDASCVCVLFLELCDEYCFLQNMQGPGGVTIKKTQLAMVFGIYDEPVTPGECNTIVEKLGDYLLDQGF